LASVHHAEGKDAALHRTDAAVVTLLAIRLRRALAWPSESAPADSSPPGSLRPRRRSRHCLAAAELASDISEGVRSRLGGESRTAPFFPLLALAAHLSTSRDCSHHTG